MLNRFLIIAFTCTGIFLNLGMPVHADEVLSWDDALHEAAKNHPDLIAAQENIVQGKTIKTITASDALPQITADLSASTQKTGSSGSSNSFSYGLSGKQLLFDGLKTVNNIHSSNERIKAAQENFKFTSTEVRLRLRQAFVNLLKAQESIMLAQEIYKIRKDNLDLISLRYQSGTEHRGALLTAQANLLQADFDVHQADRSFEIAQRQLSKELGRAEFVPIKASGVFTVSDAATQKPDYEQLASQNPSVLKLMAQLNAAAFDVKAAKGDFWPSIALDGGVSKSGEHWAPGNNESGVGVSVSLPLFEGGSRLARLAQEQSIYRQLKEQERSTKDATILALAQSWGSLQDAIENVDVQKKFLEAAEERAKIASQQYSVGLISFDNWTIIEDDLVRNKKTFLTTQADALLAEAAWVQAKGETLEYEQK